MTEVFTLFAHECAAPLRVFLLSAVLLFGITGLTHGYARLAKDRAERTRRVRRLFVGVMAVAGAMYFWMFAATCTTGARCIRAFDLNCTGSLPRVYSILAVLAIAVAFGTVVVEVVYRIRRIVPR
jgi:hypothetical protein